MGELLQSAVQNRLLRKMPADDFARLRPHLNPVHASSRDILIMPHERITRLFFPESGFVSVTTPASPSMIEVGMIGNEGLVGASPVLLGDDVTPYESFVQSPGELLQIGKAELCAACAGSVSLNGLLLRYVQTIIVQTAQTAFVNAAFGIEARLARWLLMSRDRLSGEDMALTHEFLAMMLGVQRTSVTLALQVLESRGLIRARRARITVLALPQLIAMAQHAYGVSEAEYRRLIEGSWSGPDG